MSEQQRSNDDPRESEIDPLSDPEEARVLYAALDSFRFVVCSLEKRVHFVLRIIKDSIDRRLTTTSHTFDASHSSRSPLHKWNYFPTRLSR